MKLTSIKVAMIAVAVMAMSGVAATIHSDNASAASCVNYTYKRGNRSNCTKYAQRLANAVAKNYKRVHHKNTLKQIATDGSFGVKTQNAIKDIQRRAKIYPSKTSNSYIRLKVDGVIGANTWSFLCSQGSLYDNAAYIAAGCKNAKYTRTALLK